jgi:hypothetical protein
LRVEPNKLGTTINELISSEYTYITLRFT